MYLRVLKTRTLHEVEGNLYQCTLCIRNQTLYLYKKSIRCDYYDALDARQISTPDAPTHESVRR